MNEPASDSSGDTADQPPTFLPSVSVNHLQSGPLVGVVIGVLAGVLTWGILESCFPVFVVAVELKELSASASPEEIEAIENAERAVLLADRQNTILAMTILGLIAGALFASGEAHARSAWKWVPLVGVVSGLIGGLGGAAAATIGHQMFSGPRPVTDFSPMAQTMMRQMAMLGILGLAVGIGMAIPYRKPLLLVHCVIGCVLGGLLVGIACPPLIGYFVHEVNTEVVMPASGLYGLVWLTMTTGFMALIVTGLGKRKTVKVCDRAIASEGSGDRDS